MRRVLLFSLAVWIFFSIHPARGAVFERDWKTPGDGLLTFDDVNRREWLDLSETLLEKFPGANLEERYQSVVSELNARGSFAGFAVANKSDVIAFAESAGINTTTTDFSSNAFAALNLTQLLGVTRMNTSGRVESRGYLNEITSVIPNVTTRLEAIVDYFPPQPSFVGDAGLRFGPTDFTSAAVTAVLLYRVAVPEPSSVLFAAILLAPFALLRFRRHFAVR